MSATDIELWNARRLSVADPSSPYPPCVPERTTPGISGQETRVQSNDDASSEASLQGDRKHRTVRLRNMRGGARLRQDLAAQQDCLLCAHTELELIEPSVRDFRQTLDDQGRQACMGDPTTITKKSDKKIGRRVALTFPNSIRPNIPLVGNLDCERQLVESGRWTECGIPIGSEWVVVTFGCYYGVSGASHDTQCAAINERLLSACLARALAAGDAPYILLMDSNTPIPHSNALSSAIGHRRLIDLVADRLPGTPGPTYCEGGILGPIELLGTTDTSRIDIALANCVVNPFIEEINLRWDLAVDEALDHVPIDVVLKEEMTPFSIDALAPVEPIPMQEIPAIPDDHAFEIFNLIQQHPHRKGALDKAIAQRNAGLAHLEWSRLATDHLHVLAYIGTHATPREKSPLAVDSIVDRIVKKGYTERGELRPTITTTTTKKVAKDSIAEQNGFIHRASKFRTRCRTLARSLRKKGAASTYEIPSMLALWKKIKNNALQFIQDPVLDEASDSANKVCELEEESTELLKVLQNDRQQTRTEKWWNKLYSNWRKEGAQSFFRALKNNSSSAPRTTFPDPKCGGAPTADPRRIEAIFGQAWETVYTKDPTLPDDLSTPFKIEFGKFLSTIEGIDASPLRDTELQAQSKRVWNGSAAGLHGWKPVELKALPLVAWSARSKVEILFVEIKTLPPVYLQVPVTMLRKAEGLVPLQHRGISVFTACYRMTGCAWWHRVMPQFLHWVHPSAAGGIPGRECLESVWDAQALIERATLQRQSIAAILLDYDNFFDRFDTAFFTALFEAVGLPPAICVLFSNMYSQIQRRLEISGHLGQPLKTDCGAGQGDSFSLLGALCITTIEFRMLDEVWPRVHKGCVVDDRDLVGPVEDVIGATFSCLHFDGMAGLANNIPKFVGLANNSDDRKRLAEVCFGETPLKVSCQTVLVGFHLTARRAISRKGQNQRCSHSIDVSMRIMGLHPPEALCRIALASSSLPAACYGNRWTLPSDNAMKKLPTAIIRALFGSKHHFRYPEIISTLFMDPVRLVTVAAIVFRNLLDIRRILLKKKRTQSCLLHQPGACLGG